MTLTDEQILAFQRLYKARYGQEISYEDAEEQGVQLLTFISLTLALSGNQTTNTMNTHSNGLTTT